MSGFKPFTQQPLSIQPIGCGIMCLPNEIVQFLDNLMIQKIISMRYIFPRYNFCNVRIWIHSNLSINTYIYEKKINILIEMKKKNTLYKSDFINHVTTCEQLLYFIEELKEIYSTGDRNDYDLRSDYHTTLLLHIFIKSHLRKINNK